MTFGLFDASVSIGEAQALLDVTIEVEPGTITAVIGADGAGKTTACRTLVGLLTVDSGQVARPGRQKIGYQPEAAGTWEDLTVIENLAFVAHAHGLPAAARTDQLLAATDLLVASDRLSASLSGGMRQKLAVAMAVFARPSLAVLDEPTTGLDPVSRAELWAFLASVADEGAAVLVTTAYLEEAERAARVVVLDDGHVLASGSARSIRADFPGVLSRAAGPGPDCWRRGKTWHRWWESGEIGDGSTALVPDLRDVVTVAAMARRSRR